MNPAPPNPQLPDARDPAARLAELQADRAVQGLTPAQDAEMRSLLGQDDLCDDESLDRAAAAAELAMSGEVGTVEMPSEIRQRLLRAGEAWAAQTRAGTATPGFRLSRSPLDGPLVERKLHPGAARQGGRTGRLLLTWGGWLAAAACLTITARYWTRTPNQPVTTPLDPIAKALAPVEAFDRLGARHDSGEPVVALSGTRDDGVEADLRFDSEKNEGYLAIAGLDVNDESDQQYQAWMLDAGRDHPVDLGTFDVRAVQRGAKIVVPVNARISVRAAAGFAVSREPRGGVVVPKPERIIFRADMPQMGPPAPEDFSDNGA